MAQTIKIKRGGIQSLVTTTPTLAQGELLLATGSLNGINGVLFITTASDGPSLPYAKVESISNGPSLASSLDTNFTGLLIHSSSDNKFYRYNGTTFDELPVAAGSFEGILPVDNGGTGTSSLSDIVGDSKIVVQNGTDTIVGGSDGPVVLTLSGGVVSGSSQIDGTAIQNNSIGINYFGGISGGSPVALNGVLDLTVATGSIAANGLNLVNADTINTLSASIAADIVSNTGNVEGVTGQVAYFDGTNSVSGSTSFTFASDVLTVGGSTFGEDVTVAGNLTVAGTTTTVDSTIVNISSSIIRVNYGGAVADGGIEVTDATADGLDTGSLLWDGSNGKNWWKAGPKSSEKRVVTFDDNGGGTNETIQRLDSNSHLVDSTITDDGDDISLGGNVTITTGHTFTTSNQVTFDGLTGATNNANTSIMIIDGNGIVGSVDPSPGSDVITNTLIGTNNTGAIVATTLIDGGTF